MLFKISKGPSL